MGRSLKFPYSIYFRMIDYTCVCRIQTPKKMGPTRVRLSGNSVLFLFFFVGLRQVLFGGPGSGCFLEIRQLPGKIIYINTNGGSSVYMPVFSGGYRNRSLVEVSSPLLQGSLTHQSFPIFSPLKINTALNNCFGFEFVYPAGPSTEAYSSETGIAGARACRKPLGSIH